MDLNKFLTLPISEKKQIVGQQQSTKTPFWLERLKTAVETRSPLVVFFSKELTQEYWNIIEN